MLHQIRGRNWSFLLVVFLCSSCYSYRITTHAQGGTELQETRAATLFWGLAQTPKQILTPNCDSLGLGGMTEVRMHRNFGGFLLTALTLGIYCPVIVEWKCSKPCAISQKL